MGDNMGSSETIFVRLLEEGIDVWRPVLAEVTHTPNVYRIVGIPDGLVPSDEILEFPIGSIVKCESKLLEGRKEKVAVTRCL
ncbi:MAG: hypothetical protein C5B49_01035 [Bdellovibrio sp.]|nr:MAG: hypothetical protein C5B49_01035 [Bdellovibrio sp.]